mmetsp:Transcript_808/g.3242  ORF Transcript_808/g.3242 Transcript_808/m.3242 type:complete len:207 (+) Transcript_808:977-1597(+)
MPQGLQLFCQPRLQVGLLIPQSILYLRFLFLHALPHRGLSFCQDLHTLAKRGRHLQERLLLLPSTVFELAHALLGRPAREFVRMLHALQLLRKPRLHLRTRRLLVLQVQPDRLLNCFDVLQTPLGRLARKSLIMLHGPQLLRKPRLNLTPRSMLTLQLNLHRLPKSFDVLTTPLDRLARKSLIMPHGPQLLRKPRLNLRTQRQLVL